MTQSSAQLVVTPFIQIPLSEIEFSYARSSGPGGQNVNKVNSKAILRWNFINTACLPLEVRARFFSRYAKRLTQDGDLIITSDIYRDQLRNREECLEKLKLLMETVVQAPAVRRKVKPTRSSVERRKESKRRTGEKKRQRKSFE